MKRILTLLTIGAFAWIGACSTSQAADLTFEWTANPVEEQVTNYVLYEIVNVDGSDQLQQRSVIAGDATTVTLQDVAPGVHRYVIVAQNVWGDGPLSDEVVTPPAASKVLGFQFTINVSP